MDIKFTYKQNLNLSKAEESFVLNESKKYGQVIVEKYSNRSSALDFISIVDITLKLVALTSVQAFIKGFIGEDWFKNLGREAKNGLIEEINQHKKFIKAYFDIFIRNKPNIPAGASFQLVP